MSNRSLRIRMVLALLWLVFTGAMIVWWMYFALGLLRQIDDGLAGEHQRMLILEGGTLLALLMGGGMTLIYFIMQESRQSLALRDFFSTFSHEIKTALASLRLQAESLADESDPQSQKRLLARLLADTSRVAVSVENSLYVAEGEKASTVADHIQWVNVHDELKLSWPQTEIVLQGNASLNTDRRALMSILQNLVHNAVQHGRATQIAISIRQEQELVSLTVSDNGSGFEGDRSRLGERSFRHKGTSGSGLGLYIVRSLLKKMSGRGPAFPKAPQGFRVEFEIPISKGPR